MIPPAEISVIVIFVQAVLYGLYLATLSLCLRWLLYRDEGWKLRPKVSWSMVFVTIMLFLFSTTSIGTGLWRTISTVVGGDKIMAHKLDLVNGAMENFTIVIVDAVLIYRCWEVYARSWRIVFVLLILWLGDIAIALMFVIQARGWSPQLWIPFYAFNILINLYATFAIIFRIIRTVGTSNNKSSRLYTTCRILVESGLLYTAASVLNLIAGALGTNPKFDLLSFLADIVNFTMAGIAFNLILIRVRQSGASSTNTTEADSRVLSNKEKQISAMRFNAPDSTTQDSSFLSSDMEIGGRSGGRV